MKHIFALTLAALLALLALSANAAIVGAPFSPEADARFNALEGPVSIKSNYPSARADSNAVLHTAQATWDFSVQGGAVASYPLGVSIPKSATIIRSWITSMTTPVTAASGQIGFFCQNASDIYANNASYPAANLSLDGASTGAATAFKYISSSGPCTINVALAVGAFTAGKVTAFVEYVLHK